MLAICRIFPPENINEPVMNILIFRYHADQFKGKRLLNQYVSKAMGSIAGALLYSHKKGSTEVTREWHDSLP